MANQELLPCVEINPKETPDSAVIWLHGLGADGYDFQPIVPELELPESLNTRFIFPHAQMRPVTINGGMSMRAWYDILDIQIDRVIDLEHIQESSDQIQALIQRELDAGIPANRIILAGFSQGGAVAIHTALRYEHTLAGLLALSTYMPTSESLEKEKHQANLAIPIMMGHGTNDPMVPMQLAKKAYQELVDHQYQITWHEYPTVHAVHPDEIKDIGKWIQKLLCSSK